MLSRNWILSAWLLVIASWPLLATAQDFRVDTELFQNQEKKPFLETLTIFSENKVYDFRLTAPQETTVFDAVRGQFTLLDEARRVKAVVTTQELLDFSLALETHAAQQKDRLFAFCAVPQFETTENPIEENGQPVIELRMTGKPMSYTARGHKPQQADAAKTYRHFADWCARLNATRSGGWPAGARLALNQALVERDLLPLEITRTTSWDPRKFELISQNRSLKSQHRFNWTLSGEDQKKMQRAADMMATYQDVSYDEYRNPGAKAAAAKQVRR